MLRPIGPIQSTQLIWPSSLSVFPVKHTRMSRTLPCPKLPYIYFLSSAVSRIGFLFPRSRLFPLGTVASSEHRFRNSISKCLPWKICFHCGEAKHCLTLQLSGFTYSCFKGIALPRVSAGLPLQGVSLSQLKHFFHPKCGWWRGGGEFHEGNPATGNSKRPTLPKPHRLKKMTLN